MSKKLYRGPTEARRKGGRAEARGATTRISASLQVDRILDGMNARPKRERVPTLSEVESLIVQAQEALDNNPDSKAAKHRVDSLWLYYRRLKSSLR